MNPTVPPPPASGPAALLPAELLQTAFENVPAAIHIKDLQDRFLMVNRAFAVLFGVEAPRVLGKASHEVFPEPLAAALRDDERRALATGQPREREAAVPRPEGGARVFLVRTYPVPDGTGAVCALCATWIDITERRQSEQRLTEAEKARQASEQERYWLLREAQSRAAELAGVMESIPDALFVGNEGLITLANQPALGLFGCETVEDLNRNFCALVERLQVRDARTGEEVPLERGPFFRAMDTARTQVQDLVVRHARLDRDMLLRCTAAPVRVNDQVIGAVSVCMDLGRSRQQTLIRSLIEAQEEERRAVAYELHDGLTQYVMAAQAHLESFASLSGRENPAPGEGVPAPGAGVDHDFRLGMGYLAQAVVESRRLVNGLRALALDDLGLAGALEQLLSEEKMRAGWTDTELVHNIAGRRYPKALETTIFRVAQEALTNARRHAQTTRVRLQLEQTEEARGAVHLSLEIRDWGRGFVPGEKLSEYGHLGLQGMTERVHLVGGAYLLRSAPGQGTTIFAVFPVPPAAPDEDPDGGDGRDEPVGPWGTLA